MSPTPDVDSEKVNSKIDSAIVRLPEQVQAEVVHAIAGRVRLRVPRLKYDLAYASWLAQRLQSLAGISHIQVNPAAASLIVTYDLESPLAELLAAIQQISGLTIPAKPDIPDIPAAPPSQTESPFPFSLQAAQTHLKTVGGGLIGAVAGDMVGGAVGATAGAIVLGPPGAILGSQLGVFVGGVIGAQIGAETVHQVDQITQLSREPAGLTPEKIAATLQKRAGEKIGETAGQALGGVLGRVVLGPPGQMLGAIVGGAIGSKVGEDTASPAKPVPKPVAVMPANQLSQHPQEPHWLAQTTQKFISETAAASVGGSVGRLILGPAGQPLGVKLGSRISRIMEANADRVQPPPGENRP
jgi:hypothetical protein